MNPREWCRAAARRRIAWLLAVIAACGSVTIGLTGPVLAGPSHVDVIEAEFLDQFNDERAARGLPDLVPSSGLAADALGWTQVMAATQDLEHSSAGRAEIIGRGYWSGQISVAFMESPAHRNLVVDPNLRRVGIGVVCDANDQMWVTAQFLRIDTSLPTRASSPASPQVTPRNEGSTCHSDAAAGSIRRLYLGYFSREPDRSGLNYWSTAVENGLPLTAASDAFSAAPEFQATYGSLTNSEFVDLVYRNVMGRNPDRNGSNYWVGRLRSGQTRGAIMAAFTESQEFRTRNR